MLAIGFLSEVGKPTYRGERGDVDQRLAEQAPVGREAPTRVDVASLAFCLLGNFLLRAAAAAAGTLISLYLASLHQSGMPVRARVVGLAAMLFYSAELIGSPVLGLLSDLKGRKPFMLLGPLFGGVAVQLIFLAPTIPLVLLARVFQGLSTASSVPSTLSYFSAATGDSEKARGRVMSLFEVATIVGMAGGFATGGILWDALRHSAFIAVIGIYAGSALLLWLVRDPHAAAGRARRVAERAATAVASSRPGLQKIPAPSALLERFSFVRSGSALRLIPAWIAVNAIVGLWFSHLDFQMGKADDPTQLLVGGFSGRQIGLYTAGFALLFVVGISLWALAFGRLRATQIMAVALCGLFALVVFLAFLNHSQPAEHLRIRTLIGLVSASLLVMSGFTPAALVYLAGIAEEFPQSRGSMMGLYSVFLGVGQFLGSGIGGFFADWRGVDGMIVLTAILGSISAICVAALIRQEGPLGSTVPIRAARLPPGLH